MNIHLVSGTHSFTSTPLSHVAIRLPHTPWSSKYGRKSPSATSPSHHPHPKPSQVPEKARNVGAARFNPGIIFKKRKREKHHPSSSARRLLIYGFSLFICLSLPPLCAYTSSRGAYLRLEAPVILPTTSKKNSQPQKNLTLKAEKSQHTWMSVILAAESAGE